ncbi:MAG: 3-hydroxyacyl-CoA dehydrogenase NAD-binding domain-containing protein [Actinobacteria bacterium]|nr:3-hydroxyacyl-CoA dehydrogenase NAD-binding domain-containing protein [Actinomycetota bacterium]
MGRVDGKGLRVTSIGPHVDQSGWGETTPVRASIAGIGAGLMGHGIAPVFACAGHPVAVTAETGLDETLAASRRCVALSAEGDCTSSPRAGTLTRRVQRRRSRSYTPPHVLASELAEVLLVGAGGAA